MPIHPGQSRKAHPQIIQDDHVAASLIPHCRPNAPGAASATPSQQSVRGAIAGQPLSIPADFHSVRIGRRIFPFSDCAQISAAYRASIESLGLGASQTPQCEILDASGAIVGRVSYNGRIWLGADWQSGDRPLYDPAGFYGDPQDCAPARAA